MGPIQTYRDKLPELLRYQAERAEVNRRDSSRPRVIQVDMDNFCAQLDDHVTIFKVVPVLAVEQSRPGGAEAPYFVLISL